MDLPDIASASEQWLQQAAVRLAASGNDYDRAAGLFVQSVRAGHQAMISFWAARPDCERDERCLSEGMSVGLQGGAATRD